MLVIPVLISIQSILSSLMSCTNWDSQRLGGFRCRQHVAAPIENPARLNHQTRCVDLPGDDSLGLNFYSALGKNHPVKLTGDHYVIPLDLALNLGPLSQSQTVRRKKIALHLSVNAKYPRRFKHPFKAHSLIEEPCKLATLRAFVATLGSPGHKITSIWKSCNRITYPTLYAAADESLISAPLIRKLLPRFPDSL